MKILITGGAGFIGSNLCRRLAADPTNEIICLDNLYTGNIGNIQPLLSVPGFTFIEHDVREPIDIEVDQIYHAACPASPPAYARTPVDTLETCFLGAMNMLYLARKNKARIMQFSTSEVYGDPLTHPQQESYWGNVNPNGPRSCYDEGKRCAETLFLDHHRQFGTDIRIIRIFNTYGPNMDPNDGRVVSNMIVQALKGQDLTIYGDGSQTRSFQYIDDLLEGIVRVMNDTPTDFTGPVNLGNPAEFTIRELAEMVLEKIDSNSSLTYKPLPKDDPVQRRPDITLANTVLNGWYPQIPLSDGLDRTIEYFRTLLTERASLGQ